jgi:hypothetical protein
MARNAKRPGSPQPGLAANASDHTQQSEGHQPMRSYVPGRRVVAQSPSRLDDFPASRAHALPPVPGRRLWVIAVLTCPLCGGGHTHRSGDDSMLLSNKMLRRCPTTGRLYRLGPVKRWRQARRPSIIALAA